MPDVYVVVNPSEGEHIETLSISASIWAVDTPQNRAVCERIWKQSPVHDHRERGGITLFKIKNSEERLENLLGMVSQIEQHDGMPEGDYLTFPGGFTVEVVGLRLSENARLALTEYGFSDFQETSAGFLAHKLL
jgi:hypothetical protein